MLHVAASRGHVECVRILLQFGANINQQDQVLPVGTPLSHLVVYVAINNIQLLDVVACYLQYMYICILYM